MIRTMLVIVGSEVDNALGENIIKLPFLHSLRATFPEARISWAPGVGEPLMLGPLAPLFDGHVSEVVRDLAMSKSLAAAFNRSLVLEGRRFDLVIDTQAYISRTLQARRIGHGRFISRTWGWLFSDGRPPSGQPDSPRLVHRLAALAAAAAGRLVAAPYETPLPEEWRQRAAALLPKGPVYIGLAPGAGNKERGKCWPLEGYIAVARRQMEQGRVPVFLLGPGEVAWTERLKGELPSALFPDLSPGPALTVALGARLAAAVANCSGTGHMLAAGGCLMVSLFGPTNPRKYAPWSRRVVALRAADFGDGGIGAIPVAAVADAVEHIQRFNTDVAEYLLGPQGLSPLQAAKTDLKAPLPSRSRLSLDRVPAGDGGGEQRRG